MNRISIFAFFCCFFIVSILNAQQNEISENPCPSEKIILSHISTPKGSTCKIVAKQKIFDGNYKIYYIKSFPDGSTEVESIHLLKVDSGKWILNETKVLPTT